jgi:hypothetical protein
MSGNRIYAVARFLSPQSLWQRGASDLWWCGAAALPPHCTTKEGKRRSVAGKESRHGKYSQSRETMPPVIQNGVSGAAPEKERRRRNGLSKRQRAAPRRPGTPHIAPALPGRA